MSVAIVICYQEGTGRMLDACLSSLRRHTHYPHNITVLTSRADDALLDLRDDFNFHLREMEVPKATLYGVHGAMLDLFLPHGVYDEFLLTLDSDCFPVADGWLPRLVKMMKNGCRIAGILHPWAPPPEDLSPQKIEWRVRSQHCWLSTHVACQMIRPADLASLGKKYSTGDDTGLSIVKEARARGWEIDGFMPTRCPKFMDSDDDPEFNRYSCVVFGDMMYHHGGFSRGEMGDKRPYQKEIGWVTPRVLEEKGAEFLLQNDMSYQYKFDSEEEVAKEKMERLFGYDGRNLRTS